MNKIICKKCGCEKIKVGKITGIAALQSLNSRTGLGGSEIKVYFCAECGSVSEMIVDQPNKIK